jgi:hypothetical protein
MPAPTLHWSNDSQKLMWTARTLNIIPAISVTRSRLLTVPTRYLPAVDTAGVDIGLKLKADVPEPENCLHQCPHHYHEGR